jgi:hypothetical protein
MIEERKQTKVQYKTVPKRFLALSGAQASLEVIGPGHMLEIYFSILTLKV